MTSSNQSMTDEEFAATLLHPDAKEDIAAPADLRAVRTSLTAYRAEALHWAECRSAAQPSLAAAAKRSDRWSALPQWSLALVAIVTIAGGAAHLAVTRAALQEAPPASESPVAQIDRPLTAADIAADDRLLSSIHAELIYHSASPVDSLRLKDEKGSASQTITPGVTE